MFTSLPFRLALSRCLRPAEKRILFVFSLLLLLSANLWSQRITPTTNIAVQPGADTVGIISTSTTEKLWPFAPAVRPQTTEGSPITLGVKFSSSVSGYVSGVRFFSSNDALLAEGSYTGQLWSADGALLASGIFSNVNSSDWQELVFAMPVFISANTTYVASYHTSGSKYVGTTGGFASTIINGSLTALDNLSSGGNGVFAYGATPSFPGNSVGSNYWVDVMFSPNLSHNGFR